MSSPTYEPIVFSDADRYEAWRGAMREEIQALRFNDTDLQLFSIL
jgi:rRNA maturation protein Nop10